MTLWAFGACRVSAAPADPPASPHEFRAIWIATASNLDWPSRKGLSTAQQQDELRALLDLARTVRCNAVIFQARAAGDAFYETDLAPWAANLTGKQGKASAPAWDPLAFATREAHARGLQLHAWLNPYRASLSADRSLLASNHFGTRHPETMVKYDTLLWFDPSNALVRSHLIAVVHDLAARYDLDGIHLDDYFYPYPKQGIPFPDSASYQRYRAEGGKLGLDDWRRSQVNTLVRDLSAEVKRTRPNALFGISPFGIWKSGTPPAIKGLDANDELYADARLWLREGWVDYLSPQLYWSIGSKNTSFPTLLNWWCGENVKGRHIWPGLALYNVPKEFDANEIVAQVRLARQIPRTSGHALFRTEMLQANTGGVRDALVRQAYQRPALVPASPWVDATAPEAPLLSFDAGSSTLSWTPRGGEPAFVWVVMAQRDGGWWMDILPASQTSLHLRSGEPMPPVIAVSAADRLGNESPRAILRGN